MNIPTTIRDLAAQYFKESLDIRRHLHQHPELSFEESETARYIAGRLTDWGIPHKVGIGGHGIVATIAGGNPGPTVVLRADIDALPVTEATGLPFASVTPGVMHACGHDVHTACLLSAGRILSSVAPQLSGTVRMLFQPAEEKLPGGARAMIDAGALASPEPVVAIGQHINPGLASGVVGVRSGMLMASVDDIYLSVHGVGGHAANPDQIIDPVVIAGHVIVALQQVASRCSPPEVPTVLSIGRVTANGATNVIPAVVEMEGTFRTVDEVWRKASHEHIIRIAEKTAEAMGGRCSVRIVTGYPSLVNDPDLTARMTANARAYVGDDNVQTLPLTMGGEDFAYYGRIIPGCFYNLGVCPPDRINDSEPLHSPHLVVDEAAMEIGSGLMAWNAVRELEYAVAGE